MKRLRTRQQTDVLIVGAGPVGLSAALALARAGLTVRVVDAAPGIDPRLRASTFHPPTLDMIAWLGLDEQLVEQGLRVSEFQMRQHESGERVVFNLSAISDATAHPYRLQVEQQRYCDIAISLLASLGVDVEFGNAVATLTQDDDSVTVDAGTGKIDARWLVGADGANSAIRQSLQLDYGGTTYSHSSVLVSTTFPFHERIHDLSDVSYCWSDRGPFSLLRLRGIWRASLYPGVEELSAAADESRVREWLAYIHPDARDADILDISPYRVHERCVDRFRTGRVLLAGDAAHLNPPSGGMGMNGGIHDAMNLSEKLQQVIEGNADESLLDRYDRQRRGIVSRRIIPQASANRARMAAGDRTAQLERLAELKAIAGDTQELREFLLRSSMITGLREADSIE